MSSQRGDVLLMTDNTVDKVMPLTVAGVSTVYEPGTVLLSLVVFTLLYLALGIVWYRLIRRYVREGVEPIERPEAKDVEPEPEPTLRSEERRVGTEGTLRWGEDRGEEEGT